ncbi:MAG: transketolase [Actinomycetia bacterium]|nr:transketolase [Actinomycetes bacterium]
MADEALERTGINVIRGLAMDAVQKANSGHPGTAMALAPLAHVLWTRIMKYDAAEPDWPDRDRFVLSAGHASMLLYSMLYLTGYGLELDDLRQFRQWGSRTPGHPEVHHTPGIEVTTGPLGQGFANSVGIALGEANLRSRFGPELTDHHVFGICSDGDLEEGISHEAASFAGHLGLNRLIFVYDDNHITIDGPTELSFSDNVPERFRAYGWNVIELGEAAEDLDALEGGLRSAIGEQDRPSLLVLRSHIGYPSPKFTDSAKAHGSPLGEDEVKVVKEILGLPPEEHFWVPDDVLRMYREAGRRGEPLVAEWKERVERIRAADPSRVETFELCLDGAAAPGWEAKLPRWEAGQQVATRVACAQTLSAILDVVPGIVSGGADLTGNTGTELKGAPVIEPRSLGGRQIHFGIREHGMGAIMNGAALSGGLLPAGGTFLIFSDYMRPAVRLAAMSEAKVAFVWSHDSIGLGEDGPTHQPIEQLPSLRAVPGLRVIRPADANETAAAWRVHIESTGPTAFLLTRQDVPVLEGTAEAAHDGVAAGAYVLLDGDDPDNLDLILVGTGSELQLCLAAADHLADEEGLSVRVVSFPCWELFEELEEEEQLEVLPGDVPTLAVEAASSFGWDRWVDDVVSIDEFGASSPGAVAMEEFGFTTDNVVERALELLAAGEDEEDEEDEELDEDLEDLEDEEDLEEELEDEEEMLEDDEERP